MELVTDHLEGALARRPARRLEAHLAACAPCTAYLDQMRATVAAVARLDVRDLPRAVRAELVVLAVRRRRRQEPPATPSPAAPRRASPR